MSDTAVQKDPIRVKQLCDLMFSDADQHARCKRRCTGHPKWLTDRATRANEIVYAENFNYGFFTRFGEQREFNAASAEVEHDTGGVSLRENHSARLVFDRELLRARRSERTLKIEGRALIVSYTRSRRRVVDRWNIKRFAVEGRKARCNDWLSTEVRRP